MKERIKEHLLVISIIYGIIIIALMAMTYVKMDGYIEVTTSDSFYTDLNKYRAEVANVKNESCRTEISNLIDFVNARALNGKIVLKDYYRIALTGEGILSKYDGIKTSCSISKEIAEEKGLNYMFLTASLQNDEIFQKYLYQHELRLVDNYYRMITEPSMITPENNIKTGMELSIIKTLLEIANNGGVVNEN